MLSFDGRLFIAESVAAQGQIQLQRSHDHEVCHQFRILLHPWLFVIRCLLIWCKFFDRHMFFFMSNPQKVFFAVPKQQQMSFVKISALQLVMFFLSFRAFIVF